MFLKANGSKEVHYQAVSFQTDEKLLNRMSSMYKRARIWDWYDLTAENKSFNMCPRVCSMVNMLHLI